MPLNVELTAIRYRQVEFAKRDFLQQIGNLDVSILSPLEFWIDSAE